MKEVYQVEYGCVKAEGGVIQLLTWVDTTKEGAEISDAEYGLATRCMVYKHDHEAAMEQQKTAMQCVINTEANKVIELSQKYEVDPRTHEIIDLKERVQELEAQLREAKALGIEQAARDGQFSNWVKQSLESYALGVRQDISEESHRGVSSNFI